jgi:hypothetical protein
VSSASIVPRGGAKFNPRLYMTQRLAGPFDTLRAGSGDARRSIYNYEHLSRKLSFPLQYFGQDGLQVRIEVTFPAALQVPGIADFGLERLCLLAGTEV